MAAILDVIDLIVNLQKIWRGFKYLSVMTIYRIFSTYSILSSSTSFYLLSLTWLAYFFSTFGVWVLVFAPGRSTARSSETVWWSEPSLAAARVPRRAASTSQKLKSDIRGCRTETTMKKTSWLSEQKSNKNYVKMTFIY